MNVVCPKCRFVNRVDTEQAAPQSKMICVNCATTITTDTEGLLRSGDAQTVSQLLGTINSAEPQAALRRPAAVTHKRGDKRLLYFALIATALGVLLSVYFFSDLVTKPAEQNRVGVAERAASSRDDSTSASLPATQTPSAPQPPATPVSIPTPLATALATPKVPAKDDVAEEKTAHLTSTIRAPVAQPLSESRRVTEDAATPPGIDRPVESENKSRNSGGGRLTVQVGSYNTPADANAHAARLRATGIETRVVRATIPNRGVWYRVQTGSFTTQAEAARYAAQLRAKGASAETYVTRH